MSAPRQVRVIVGDDQTFVREGIVHVLEDDGFDVVGTAADAQDLARKTGAYCPDVVITDIQMPPYHADHGLRAALASRRARPGTGVLVLSQFLEDQHAFDLVADGAQGAGYLLKERSATWPCSPMRCAAWPPASRCWTRTWSRGWWAASARQARSRN